MFDQLFVSRQARQRHNTSPLRQERLDYLQHCAEQGYSPTTLRPLATDLLLIQNVLGLPESFEKLDPASVKAAIEKWTSREPKYFSYKNGVRGRENLPQRAMLWLRHMDRLQVPPPETNAYGNMIDDFAGYMRQQRGLSEVTIAGRCWYVEDLLQWFFRDHLSLSEITTPNSMRRSLDKDGMTATPEAPLRLMLPASAISSVTPKEGAGVGGGSPT
jgi:hypothetical protein